MKKSRIKDCKIYNLNSIVREDFKITEVSLFPNGKNKIKRIYYLYDIPSSATRGGHAHKDLYQIIIAISGSFRVILDDGFNKVEYYLNDPNKGLLIVPGIWRELDLFSSGGTCMVLASELYNEEDYIRNYENFKELKV